MITVHTQSTKQPIYRLDMVRGQKTVVIGWFWNKDRASAIGHIIDWDDSWNIIVIDETSDEEIYNWKNEIRDWKDQWGGPDPKFNRQLNNTNTPELPDGKYV